MAFIHDLEDFFARYKDDLCFQGRVGPGCLWGGDAEGKQEQQIPLKKCNCQLDLAQITSIPNKDNFLFILKSCLMAAFSLCQVFFETLEFACLQF